MVIILRYTHEYNIYSLLHIVDYRFGQMNDLVIIQTTQGLAKYLMSDTDSTCSVRNNILFISLSRKEEIIYVIKFILFLINYVIAPFAGEINGSCDRI